MIALILILVIIIGVAHYMIDTKPHNERKDKHGF